MQFQQIDAWPLDSKVSLADGIEGTIVEVAIRSGPNVRYLVAWWNGGNRIEQWISESELRVAGPQKLRIGFRVPGEQYTDGVLVSSPQ
jgi:hypothetical protein